MSVGTAMQDDAQNAETLEHFDVLIVGAGLSGIAAADHLQTKSPWATYAVLEARDAIGGTWDLFRYPGVRSDSDMFTLGYSMRPWESDISIADGDSIRHYIEDTASQQGIDEHIRFGHKIQTADWSTEDSRWTITAEINHGEIVRLTCGFLFTCTGYYRYDHGYVPDFAGMDDFKGTIVHPQGWPADLDYKGKKVVVIGSGATAVTLIPSMAEDVGHITMLQRSPTYMAAIPPTSPVAALFKKVLPSKYYGPATRWFHALSSQMFFEFCQRWPNAAKKMLLKGVKGQLPDGYDVEKHFTPRYDPWDQRLCAAPDGDFFRSIRRGQASVVTDTVDTFTETGIRLASGEELDADIVVTATGLELLFLGGIEASVDGEIVDLPSKLTYKGMMLEGVPNLALAIGYTNASWTLKCDLTCDYVARLLNEMRSRGVSQCMATNTGGAATPEPILDLTAGYVQRSAHKFPMQGDTPPWRVHQSYIKDFRALKRGDLVDDAMVFSNPVKRETAKKVSETL